jgi:cytochrome c
MQDRFNTIAGWALAGGIAALGLSIVSGKYFHSEKPERPGYVVEAVEDAAGGAAVAEPLPVRLAKGDVAKGESGFKQCASCHTVTQGGANGIGPNLYATLGEPIGQGKGGFAFSDALKGVGGSWDLDKMDAWLTNPRKFAPGTKMTFAGISDPQLRADVILYLNKQGSNLPLPAAPAAGSEPDNAGVQSNSAAEGADVSVNVQQATPGEGTPAKDPQAAVQAEKKK